MAFVEGNCVKLPIVPYVVELVIDTLTVSTKVPHKNVQRRQIIDGCLASRSPFVLI